MEHSLLSSYFIAATSISACAKQPVSTVSRTVDSGQTGVLVRYHANFINDDGVYASLQHPQLSKCYSC